MKDAFAKVFVQSKAAAANDASVDRILAASFFRESRVESTRAQRAKVVSLAGYRAERAQR